MKRTLYKLITLVFPERDDARVVRALSPDTLQTLYRPRNAADVLALLPFSDHRVRACIHEAKFHENEKAIQLLGAILSQHFAQLPAYILVPIPLSHAREKERGYNQVTRIAKATDAHIKIVDSVLYKHTDTAPQTKLTREARLSNVQNVFGIDNRHAHKIVGKHVVLLDDVTTTGATLKAARKSLATLGPQSITCIALAH